MRPTVFTYSGCMSTSLEAGVTSDAFCGIGTCCAKAGKVAIAPSKIRMARLFLVFMFGFLPWATCSFHLLNIPRLPRHVNRRFGWGVEAEDGEVASARRRGEPVAVLSGGRFRANIKIGRAVGVHRGL